MSGADQNSEKRITLRDMQRWAVDGTPFAMLTCYDATTARWLWRGGVKTVLVGDTAAEVILGHDSTLPAPMDFMVQITAAVRRGAPKALVMADMPFGSYQCGEDEAVANAVRFLKEGMADLVKMEVDDSFAPLVERMAHAGVPVVAHIGSRPQTVRAMGGYKSAGRTKQEADRVVDTAELLVARGAVALLVEAVPGEVGKRIVECAVHPDTRAPVPVIGCGAGPSLSWSCGGVAGSLEAERLAAAVRGIDGRGGLGGAGRCGRVGAPRGRGGISPGRRALPDARVAHPPPACSVWHGVAGARACRMNRAVQFKPRLRHVCHGH